MIRLSSAAMIRLSSAATILLAGATLLVLLYVTAGRNVAGVVIGLPSDPSRLFRSGDDDSVGTRCAVLIAGSKGYGNYRHQVKKRTAKDNTAYGSHVMQFGDIGLSKENLFLYMGTNSPFVDDNCLRPPQKGVDLDQQDANLLYFWLEVSLSLVTNCVCHAHYSRPRHGHLPGNTHPNAAGVRAQLGLFQCLRLHALDLSHGTTGF